MAHDGEEKKARQVPCTQTSSVAQTVPQAPQLSGSLEVDAQAPLQAVSPAGQALVEQVPPTHRCPPAVSQGLPQAPQFAESAFRSTQAPLQTVRPGRQAQAPERHAWVAAHATPQAPQSTGLVCRFGQIPAHSVPAQLQAPPVHRSPAGHGVPQPPQLLSSVAVSTQAPLQTT